MISKRRSTFKCFLTKTCYFVAFVNYEQTIVYNNIIYFNYYKYNKYLVFFMNLFSSFSALSFFLTVTLLSCGKNQREIKMKIL